jgi:hypothetical protein
VASRNRGPHRVEHAGERGRVQRVRAVGVLDVEVDRARTGVRHGGGVVRRRRRGHRQRRVLTGAARPVEACLDERHAVQAQSWPSSAEVASSSVPA